MAPLLLLSALLIGPAAAELLTLLPDRDTSTIPACQDDTALSCILVSVDYAALEGEQLILPGGIMVSLKDRPLTDSVTFANSDGVEATFSLGYSGVEMEVYGEVEIENGTIFTLEPCSSSFPGCHVLKQEDMEVMSQLEANEESAWTLVEEEGRQALTAVESRALWWKEQQGIDDTTTVVTFSLKVYFTHQFAASTDDIPLFVEQMIAEINQGYMNSNIPLRVELACIEAANLNDKSGRSMLKTFKNYKSSVAELRQSADAAMLLVNKFNFCGVTYLKTFKNDLSVTVVMKGCALGYFTPAHELGHNFGAMHDRLGANRYYPYGLGKHIGFIGSRGYRTVMAGTGRGKYKSRVNYWSNPNIEYRGMKTGTAEEDNARLLTQNRFIFAAQGDESDETCIPTAPTFPFVFCWAGQCVKDLAFGGFLPFKQPVSDTNTPQECRAKCLVSGFTYAGVEFGNQCFCGNLSPPFKNILPAGNCDFTCSGDPNQSCGGWDKINIYTSAATAWWCGIH